MQSGKRAEKPPDFKKKIVILKIFRMTIFPYSFSLPNVNSLIHLIIKGTLRAF